MKRGLLFIICLVVINSLASTANAAVIGSYTVSTGPDYRGAEQVFTTNLWISTDPVWPQITLFNGPDLSIFDYNGIDVFGNIGRTFWVASDQDDPEFSRVISQMTDGLDDYLWIAIGTSGDGVFYPVPLRLLVGRPNDFDITDLHGYTIERIGLTINAASHTIDPEAVYPHVYYMTVTCTFESEPVPEPTAFVTLIAGIGGLCILKPRNRRALGCGGSQIREHQSGVTDPE